MAVPAMAAMIATSAARSEAVKNAQEGTSKKKTTAKKPAPAKMPVRKMPEGVKFSKNKNAVPNPPSNAKFRTTRKPGGKLTKEQIKNIQSKGPAKPVVKTIKAPVKKKVTVMPDKISPSKMTPAQKARYLKNPERYDG
jgi:hypothetical protein